MTIIANGGLDVPQRGEQVLRDGADMIALGKAALANPDLPHRLATHTALYEFDASILGPIANIKDSELTLT